MFGGQVGPDAVCSRSYLPTLGVNMEPPDYCPDCFKMIPGLREYITWFLNLKNPACGVFYCPYCEEKFIVHKGANDA